MRRYARSMSHDSAERAEELQQLDSDFAIGGPVLSTTSDQPPVVSLFAQPASVLGATAPRSESEDPPQPSAHWSHVPNMRHGLEGPARAQVNFVFSSHGAPFNFSSGTAHSTVTSGNLPGGDSSGPQHLPPVFGLNPSQLREAAQRAAALIAESRGLFPRSVPPESDGASEPAASTNASDSSTSYDALRGLGGVVFGGTGSPPVFVNGSSPGLAGNLFRRLTELRRMPSQSPATVAQLDVLLNEHACILEALTEESESCSICLDELAVGELGLHMPCCGNRFHRACALRWLSRESSRCPVCRAPLLKAPSPAKGEGPGEEVSHRNALQTVAELKQRCSERGLDCSGCLEKRELVTLLESHEKTQAPLPPAASAFDVPLDPNASTLHAAAMMAARAFAEAMTAHVSASTSAAARSASASAAAAAAVAALAAAATSTATSTAAATATATATAATTGTSGETSLRRRSPSSSEGRPSKRRKPA